MMAVLGRFSPDQEIYSIDECFLGMDGFAHLDLAECGRRIRAQVRQWLGLPVCVGFGETKTLAKLANHVAKKQPGFGGVCDLAALSPAGRDALLEGIDVGEVWGVGHRGTPRLKALGLGNVKALRDADPKWLRREFSVVLERTVAELNGTPCIDLEETAPAKQQIMSSRAFGAYVYDLAGLEEAVATYVGRAAEKLRRQGSVAGAVQVYVRTNPFKADHPQYQRGLTVPLAEPSRRHTPAGAGGADGPAPPVQARLRLPEGRRDAARPQRRAAHAGGTVRDRPRQAGGHARHGPRQRLLGPRHAAPRRRGRGPRLAHAPRHDVALLHHALGGAAAGVLSAVLRGLTFHLLQPGTPSRKRRSRPPACARAGDSATAAC